MYPCFRDQEDYSVGKKKSRERKNKSDRERNEGKQGSLDGADWRA